MGFEEISSPNVVFYFADLSLHNDMEQFVFIIVIIFYTSKKLIFAQIKI